MIFKSYFIATVLLFTNFAHADQIYETVRSIRSLGMGGMYIPIVNDADAVFYNPAALGKLKGLNLLVPGVGVQTNTDSIDMISKISGIDANDPTTFNAFYGKTVEASASGRAAMALPYFGFGYYTNYDATLQLHNPANPSFNTYFLNDSAYVLGGAVAIGPESYLGMNFKRVNRWGGVTKDLGLSTVASGVSLDKIGQNFDNKGTGYGVDFAVMTELPLPLKPTFALVWQDVGNTAFTQTSGTDAPPHITQNLSAGAGVGFDLPGLDWTAGAELRHLLEPDVQIGKKIHLGTEVSLPMIDLRGGISQGYFSYGVGINVLIFHIDAVSYTEELGVYPGQVSDNRYAVSLSIDLSFDANFHFTDNDGKRRKLKQRR